MSKTGTFARQLALAAVVALMASMAVVAVAGAQSPPSPPSRFVGNVTVLGAPAAPGTVIEARIGNTTCGVSTVFMSGAEARYTLDSPALDPAQNPACGVDGSTVSFFVGGQKANETGSWANYRLNTVNLTVSAAPTATPTKTPAAPVAGTTDTTADGSSAPLVELMLLAAAFGLSGVAIAARVRKS
jgi:hypothetical protein